MSENTKVNCSPLRQLDENDSDSSEISFDINPVSRSRSIDTDGGADAGPSTGGAGPSTGGAGPSTAPLPRNLLRKILDRNDNNLIKETKAVLRCYNSLCLTRGTGRSNGTHLLHYITVLNVPNTETSVFLELLNTISYVNIMFYLKV